MSVSTVGSNASSIVDLMNQRRQNLQATAVSVQANDPTPAQQPLTTVQSATTPMDGSLSTGAQAANPYRSSLATDLTSLASEMQSGDTSQATIASNTFQTNPAATGASQRAGGAHHGHHHHGGGSNESSSQQIAAALFSPDQTPANTALGTDASGTSGDALSQLLASLDGK